MAVSPSYDPCYWAGVVDNCEAFAGTARGLPQNAAVRVVIERQSPARQVYIRCAAPNYYFCGDYFRDRYQDGFLHGLLSSWGRRETVVIQAPSAERRPKTEEEKRDASAATDLWIGGLALLVAACVVGVFHGQYDVESRALNWAKRDRTNAQTDGVPGEVLQLLAFRAEIHERNYENSRNRLFSGVTALAGAASLLAGVVVAPMLITAGYAALLAGTAFGLYNSFYHWGDAAENEALCAQKLQPMAMKARAAIARDYQTYVPAQLYPAFAPPSYEASFQPAEPSAPPAYV